MQENHQREQYFFDADTLERLAVVAHEHKGRPLLLCCPMVGQVYNAWYRDGIISLDIDDRFSGEFGFHVWDIYRPTPLAVYEPTLIICDPPFNKVRMDQLFAAVRALTPTRAVEDVKLLIAIDPKHAGALMAVFSMYGLRPTGFKPSYVTVSDGVGIEFYSNLSEGELAPLF